MQSSRESRARDPAWPLSCMKTNRLDRIINSDVAGGWDDKVDERAGKGAEVEEEVVAACRG